jgi:DNA-binding response OmpR family regulator
MAGLEKKTTLLIVDDDAAIRKLLARIAQRQGFEVDTARDGIDALEKFEKKQYQIAIVDLMMPRLSGYELVQKINAIVPRPIVIVATALTNGDVATLDDSLVRRVIRKPFDINAVAQALVDTAKQLVQEASPQVLKFDAATGTVAPAIDQVPPPEDAEPR